MPCFLVFTLSRSPTLTFHSQWFSWIKICSLGVSAIFLITKVLWSACNIRRNAITPSCLMRRKRQRYFQRKLSFWFNITDSRLLFLSVFHLVTLTDWKLLAMQQKSLLKQSSFYLYYLKCSLALNIWYSWE